MKEIQARGEAASLQKKTSSISKHQLFSLISIFVGSFLPSWSRIRIHNNAIDSTEKNEER
jgi:hypothetical protein